MATLHRALYVRRYYSAVYFTFDKTPMSIDILHDSLVVAKYLPITSILPLLVILWFFTVINTTVYTFANV